MKKLILLFLVMFVAGCTDDEPQTGVGDNEREAMLRSLAENVIAPGFTEVSANSTGLSNAVTALMATPSSSTLLNAQQAWITLGKSWKRVEFYQQGPLDQDKDSWIYKIDIGAADRTQRNALIPAAALQAAITDIQNPTLSYVEGLPARLQGLFAIEALLFSGSNDEVLASFTTAADAQNRLNYLGALSASLELRFKSLANAWSPSGAAFLEFISAKGTYLGSSLGMLMNDMVYLAEMMKNEKIARPLGYLSTQVPQPDSVEARLSKQSLAFFIENINGIEHAFTSDADGRTGIGIDSLLNTMEATVGESNVNLSDAVKTHLAAMRTRALALGPDIPTAVRTNSAKVEEMYSDCLILLKLLKVDVVSQLGVMITTLEGDGD